MKKVFFFLLIFFPIFSLSATAYVWNSTSNNWNAPANWTPAGTGVPLATTDTATFNVPSPVALRTITLDVSPQIGTLTVLDGYVFSTATANIFNFTSPTVVNVTTVNNNATFDSSVAMNITSSVQFNVSTSNPSFFTQIGGTISNNTANAGSIASIGSGPITMSGVISDGGAGGHLSVIQSGTGTWTLSGANTFSGGVTISAGQVVVGNASGLGTGPLVCSGGTVDLRGFQPVVNNFSGTGGSVTSSVAGGILNVNNSTSTSYSGSITNGSGQIALNLQAGTLLLSGSNSYTGNTTVTSGTLQGGVNNAFGSASALVMNGGVLDLLGKNQTFASLTGAAGSITSSSAGQCAVTVNGSSVTSYSGSITNGSGIVGITKSGSGTQTISGLANNYTGNTTVTAGTLRGGVANAFGTASALVVNGGTMDLFGNNQTFTALSGTGGTITSSVAGPNPHTLTINGTIVSDYSGTITNGASTISLRKNGTGTQTLSGVTSIGDAIVAAGALVINNSFAAPNGLLVNAGGVLEGTGPITVGAAASGVTVDGTLSPGNSIGTMNITGDLTLNGELQNEISPIATDRVNVSGTLTINPGASLVIAADPGFYSSTTYLIASAGTRAGTFSSVTLPSFVLNAPLFFHMSVLYPSNQVMILLQRNAFSDFFASGNSGAVASCLDGFASTATGDLADVITAILELGTLNEVEQALLQLQPSLFTSMDVVQENNMMFMRKAIAQHMTDDFYSCQKKDGIAVWVTPIGATMAQKHHKKEPGYRANTAGFFFGLDNYISSYSSMGIGVGYDYNHLHWFQKGSFADTNSVYLALYGQWGSSPLYLQGGVMGGYNSFKTNRHIQFGAMNRHAKGDGEGATAEGYLQLGVNLLHSSRWILDPFVAVDYSYVHDWGFSEIGAQSMNLHIDAKNADLLTAEGGIDFRACFSQNHHAYEPYLQLKMIREERFFGEHENARFFHSCPMDTKGYYPSRTLGGVAGGIRWIAPQGGASLSYQGEYGARYNNHSFYLEFTINSPQYHPPRRGELYR